MAALPTIKKLIADGGKVILCSHLGKPKGEPKPELSLAPVAVRLSELLGQEVKFAADPEVVGPNAKAAVEAMKDGEVVLLENTRYRAEETKNGEAFSKDLASLCDVYVDDAFGTAHRAHCSNVGVTQYVDTAVVGYLMQKEIDFLGNAVDNPVRPFVAILGGAKVADKLNVISNLLEKCDTLIIGGGMAFTFLKAQGKEIGKSLVDDTKLDYCREMVEKAAKLGKKLLLPVDAAVAASFPDPIDAPIEVQNVSVDAIPADTMGLDIGPETAKLYADTVKSAKTVVWNGPMGVFENPTLAQGTIAVAKALADTEATTIIGGGDSAAAVNQLGFGDKMTHISTGGGAREAVEALRMSGGGVVGVGGPYEQRAAAAAALAELGRKGSPGAFLRAISRHKTGADGGDDPAFALYQEKLEGKLDFDDLLLETLRQWEGGRSDRRFTHLLVDEFQDIDRLQLRLLRAWRREGGTFFAIGDPDQSIYGFRGADAGCFSALGAERTVRLTENYRSTPEILAAALPVAEAIDGAPRRMETHSPHGAEVRLLTDEGDRAEAIFVAKEIARMVGGIGMLEAQALGAARGARNTMIKERRKIKEGIGYFYK